MIRGSGCSNSRLAKAAGAEVAVQQRNKKWQAAEARSTFEAHFQIKMRKTPHGGTAFGSSGVQTWHAAVARNRFATQIAKNMRCSDHFWTAALCGYGTAMEPQ